MKATYDPIAKALYVRVCDLALQGGPIKSREMNCGSVIDTQDGVTVGYEFLLAGPLEIESGSGETRTVGTDRLVVASTKEQG